MFMSMYIYFPTKFYIISKIHHDLGFGAEPEVYTFRALLFELWKLLPFLLSLVFGVLVCSVLLYFLNLTFNYRYLADNEAERCRNLFDQGRIRIMLLSERYYFYRRYHCYDY